jgi:hypothetical protein
VLILLRLVHLDGYNFFGIEPILLDFYKETDTAIAV